MPGLPSSCSPAACALFALLWSPWGCKSAPDTLDGNETDADTDTDTDTDTDADTDTDGLITEPGVGTLLLEEILQPSTPNDWDTFARAAFVEDDLGVLNLAECLDTEWLCRETTPAVGDAIELGVSFEVVDNLEFFEPGHVVLHDLVLSDVFHGQLGAQNGGLPPDTLVDWSIGGGLVYEGTEELHTVPRFELLSPPLQDHLFLFSEDVVHFEWVPAPSPDTEVHLWAYDVWSEQQLGRLYNLEDDGEFDLQVQDLGLSQNAQITFVIGRMRVQDLVVNGRAVHAQLGSRQAPRATISFPPADHTEIDAADQCDLGAAPLVAGRYYAVVPGFNGDYDPGVAGCTGSDVPGSDATFPIRVEPGEQVTAVVLAQNIDVAGYLVADCDDMSTCVAGANDSSGFGTAETVQYTNTTSAPQDFFLVIDGGSTMGIVSFELSFDPT